ncbi:MAG: outer membrane beta-barrel protein, partial [Ignavibacteriaceae bacterium]|nr:outer membrane beta-barrel protein [Ignavibacteriaceae bacterium]
MKKFLLLLSLLMLLSLDSFSQSKFNAGAYFNLGFPIGSFSDVAKTGTGGSLFGEYVVSSPVSITLAVSYQNFPGDFNKFAVGGKTYDVSVNSIPILAGIRYYFDEMFFGILET